MLHEHMEGTVIIKHPVSCDDDNITGMTCFTNLDYKYFHISFVAPIHWGRRLAPNYSKTPGSSSVKVEVSFASSPQEKNQGPRNPLLLLLLAVTRCHC